ncbi:enoyl-CoA hydratase/isomerase family protein [Pseudonocardia nigra]|uniref:enoyl-CoA hydratase/isomerase family protein n=1 Tax=Pseudonocardia nigra TaxID=1921578 RepID=UPI001C5ECDAC|nr:enoyl-CoA hydratase/isomerase family protein [Pseudonocardia nigra]
MGAPIVTDEDHVRWITINRPEIANALRIEDLGLIADAVRGIDDDVRAVVLTGAGDRAFSAGMHLDTFRSATPVTARRLIGRVGDFLRAVRRAPVPTVAVLNGVCLGAAFELALACDIRIAQPGVRVGLPEVKLGIPSVADAALLPAFVGLSRAREMILTGDLYDLEALGPGFANRVVEPDGLRAETAAMLAKLTLPTRQVIAAQKSLFETWLDTGISTSVSTSVDVFGDLFADPATVEAVESYAAATRRAR